MRAILFLIPGILALCIAHASLADDKFVVVVPAALNPGTPIAESVRQECSVDTNVGNHVFQKVSEKFPGTEQTRDPSKVGSDKTVVQITLIGVLGVGGGSWSGSKSMTIRADALRNAKVIATTNLHRESRGGLLGGVSGTCAIMDRIAGALGQDVAVWLPAALLAAKYTAQPADQPTAETPKVAEPAPAAVDKPAGEPKQ